MDWGHALELVFIAGAVYGGIRMDIRSLHAQVAEAMSAARRAHERLDNHLEKGK